MLLENKYRWSDRNIFKKYTHSHAKYGVKQGKNYVEEISFRRY